MHSPSPQSERGREGGREGMGEERSKVHKPHTIQRPSCTQMNNNNLELFLEASSLHVSCYLPHHLVDDDSDVSCHYISLSTHHQLTQRVMDEHILGLHTRSVILCTQNTYISRQVALCQIMYTRGSGHVVHLCLDHLHALASQVLEHVEDTQSPLSLDLLHHSVQEDEGASAAHPHTAVHQQRQVQAGRVLLAHTMDEGDDGHGIAGHTMVWPGSVVHVSDRQLLFWVRNLRMRDRDGPTDMSTPHLRSVTQL